MKVLKKPAAQPVKKKPASKKPVSKKPAGKKSGSGDEARRAKAAELRQDWQEMKSYNKARGYPWTPSFKRWLLNWARVLSALSAILLIIG